MTTETSKRRKPKRTAWIIIHCEIFEAGFYDEMIFHVASSWRKAERYLVTHEMVMYSWWKVEVHGMDRNDYPEPLITHYSNKGKPLKSAPDKKAWAAFERWNRRSLASKAEHPWPPLGNR
jgi:hypothetical protein